MNKSNYLNTLFVTTPGAYLFRDHENLVVKVENEEKLRVPMHHLGSVVCFGVMSVSTGTLEACAEAGVGLSFLSENGRFVARIEGEPNGSVEIRRAQFAAGMDTVKTLALARSFILGKLYNSRQMLLRAARETDSADDQVALRGTADLFSGALRYLERAGNLDELRGREGDAARAYFETFACMVKRRREVFGFKHRSRRPPLDPMNALLSFLYALLRHDVESALLSVGLDPAVGFLHADRPGRPSLALDMQEELRAPFADRLALVLVNREQLKPDDFVEQEGGSWRLKDDARKTVLVAWQERKQETITHPVTKEEIPLALVPHVQARLLARTLRGDLKEYPPFTQS
ncbi:MAG TPA: type I-C CRISPR-associated endonuclease Cas1c [Verrucomicrobiae bacterium]|nr:type I-C CRISPR-associated endonuclease Cas1c [Verrucomicrobiae bacterium]